MDATVEILRDHLHDTGLDRLEHFDQPLFQNRRGGRLSRSGVRYILDKYVHAVRSNHPSFTQPVSPHSLRHTKGMHLLQSGVSLEIIRDFLGHADVKTTQIYARANLEMKRKALEKSSRPGESHPQALPEPDVSVSAHPALTVQPPPDTTTANARTVRGRGA